jgi:type IV pilus assembly protein PilM
MFIQHLRVPKMDDEALKKALPWEARGKIPIDPTHAVLRHHIAGTVFQEQEERYEIILMAAGKDLVNQFISTAAKAKLDIVGMNVEPAAIVDCFSHIYRRKTDAEATSCFVDIGCGSTRAVIARGGQMLFARSIPMGGDHLTRATAAALSLSFDEAKLLRLRLCAQQPSLHEIQPPAAAAAAAPQEPETEAAPGQGFAILNASMAAAQTIPIERRTPQPAKAPPEPVAPAPSLSESGDSAAQQARAVEQACRETLVKLVEELDLCRRYYEATFPNKPVDRLIFVGGEAKHRSFCQFIARELGLAAQVGDPLVRMGRISEIGIESGIDRRQPQPNWSVAIGLSLGPAVNAEKAAQAA